jgi:CheY-like chemotaxis protein
LNHTATANFRQLKPSQRNPEQSNHQNGSQNSLSSCASDFGRVFAMSTKARTRILVVEDDISVRLTISKLLTDQGYEVSTASDGFDALLRLNDTVPDLILSDLNMPQMSGFELLSVVRRRFPEILVVASSGAYYSSEIPSGVIADAFYAKGEESSSRLLEIIADLIAKGPTSHKGQNAPVWIPRNGKDHNGKPYVLLTCTQCLRSFPFTVDHEPTGEVLQTSCIYCPHEVNYIIDFSRSVNSPEKRAAWKAAFLKRQEKCVPAVAGPDDGSTEIDRKSEPTEWV